MASKPTAERVAKRFIEAMAYKRVDFKNKIESHLTGAVVEFYKATLAKKNGQSRWVQHWMTEVKNLVETKLVAEILHPIRGFKDRRKAFDEAVAEIKAGDASYRRYAETTIKRDYKLTKLKETLDEADTAAFWARVNDVAENALAATEKD
jgi:di/tripeptidase